jgi:hypothetical protein
MGSANTWSSLMYTTTLAFGCAASQPATVASSTTANTTTVKLLIIKSSWNAAGVTDSLKSLSNPSTFFWPAPCQTTVAD